MLLAFYPLSPLILLASYLPLSSLIIPHHPLFAILLALYSLYSTCILLASLIIPYPSLLYPTKVLLAYSTLLSYLSYSTLSSILLRSLISPLSPLLLPKVLVSPSALWWSAWHRFLHGPGAVPSRSIGSLETPSLLNNWSISLKSSQLHLLWNLETSLNLSLKSSQLRNIFSLKSVKWFTSSYQCFMH